MRPRRGDAAHGRRALSAAAWPAGDALREDGRTEARLSTPECTESVPKARTAVHRSRRLWVTLLALLLVSGCHGRTQPRRIVGLCSSPMFEPIFHGLQSRLGDLGLVEGVDVTYEMRLVHAGDTPDRPLTQGADVLFAFPTEAAVIAKSAVPAGDIPIVFAYAGIEQGNLVASVRVPGGNVTGVRFPGPEQIGKRLELLHRIAPRAVRVWVGYQVGYPNSPPALSILRSMAPPMGIRLVEVPLRTLDDLDADLDRRDGAAETDVDAILLMPDVYNHSPRGWGRIKAFAARHRVIVAGSFLSTVQDGAVFGNANDLEAVGRLAAPLVRKVLQGIPAGTIPVVTPEQDLYVNYGRARELGLSVPEGLLRQARVIIR